MPVPPQTVQGGPSTLPVPRQTRHASSPMPGASAGPSSPAFGGVAGSGCADGFVVDITGSFCVA
ncbi:hypothetical protein BO443_60212 [Burkholderia orbicola]